MSQLSANQRRLIWAALGLVITAILLAFLNQERKRRAALSSAPRVAHAALPVYGHAPPFRLTNHLAQPVTLDTLKGKVWLADIIFTRCPGPCAQMTARMRELQDALPAEARVRLVTLTTDPEFDTPEVLGRYAKRFGAAPERWDFLTGPKPDVLTLAAEGLKLTALDKDPAARESANDLFIHSTIAVLVDSRGRLRGSFQLIGIDPGEEGAPAPEFPWEETKRTIVKAVNELLNE